MWYHIYFRATLLWPERWVPWRHRLHNCLTCSRWVLTYKWIFRGLLDRKWPLLLIKPMLPAPQQVGLPYNGVQSLYCQQMYYTIQYLLVNPYDQYVYCIVDVRAAPNTQVSSRRANDSKCIICLEDDADAVFYRCGHLGTCYSCALRMKSTTGNCPVCRAPIVDILRAYRISNEQWDTQWELSVLLICGVIVQTCQSFYF